MVESKISRTSECFYERGYLPMARMNWWKVEKDGRDLLADKREDTLHNTSEHKTDCPCYGCVCARKAKEEALRTGATYTFYTPRKRHKRKAVHNSRIK